MKQSFFALTPQPPEPPFDPHMDWCVSLSEAEYATFEAESQALAQTLQDALDAYCKVHDTGMGVCIDAVKCLLYCLEKTVAEDSADA